MERKELGKIQSLRVEVTFESNMLKSWRLLTEVL